MRERANKPFLLFFTSSYNSQLSYIEFRKLIGNQKIIEILYFIVDYDIFDLVITISELYSDIEIYNLYKKMGKEPELECVPFTNPTLEELQLLTLNAIGVFAKKSLERI